MVSFIHLLINCISHLDKYYLVQDFRMSGYAPLFVSYSIMFKKQKMIKCRFKIKSFLS